MSGKDNIHKNHIVIFLFLLISLLSKKSNIDLVPNLNPTYFRKFLIN